MTLSVFYVQLYCIGTVCKIYFEGATGSVSCITASDDVGVRRGFQWSRRTVKACAVRQREIFPSRPRVIFCLVLLGTINGNIENNPLEAGITHSVWPCIECHNRGIFVRHGKVTNILIHAESEARSDSILWAAGCCLGTVWMPMHFLILYKTETPHVFLHELHWFALETRLKAGINAAERKFARKYTQHARRSILEM